MRCFEINLFNQSNQHKMNRFIRFFGKTINTKEIVFASLIVVLSACSSVKNKNNPEKMDAYLMTYFKDDTHGLYFALSNDGYTFTDVNSGNPVIAGDTIAEQKEFVILILCVVTMVIFIWQ